MTALLVAASTMGLLALGASDLPVREVSDPAVHADQAAYATTVQVRFLGAAGFLIRRGKDAVLTAPLYSTPSIFKVLDERSPVIVPRPDRIARFHPDVEDVQAILVGHAHYDHLMDVPYVWERTPGAVIFGSLTTRHILLGYQGREQRPEGRALPSHVPRVNPANVVALDDPGDPGHFKVDSRNGPGEAPKCTGEHRCPDLPLQAGGYVRVGPRVRIRALGARHPPQFLEHHQGPCCVASPRKDPPMAIDDFREGNVLVYLIDFLDEQERPVFRLYYQDVPADGKLGWVPDDVIAERPVDVALLCAGNAGVVTEPERIVENLKPAAVIVGHWEDFFQPQDRPYREAPFQAVGKYYRCLRRELDQLDGGPSRKLVVPKPGVLLTFAP